MRTGKQKQVFFFFSPFLSSWISNELPEADAVSAEAEQSCTAEGWKDPEPTEAPGCIPEGGMCGVVSWTCCPP